MKSVAGLFALALALWGFACGGYYLGQDRLIFLGAPPVAPGAPARAVRFEVDGAAPAGSLVNPEAAVNVVYFGGNAEAIPAHPQRFASIGDARTLLVDYRGYGRSTGAPSERALVDDAVRYVPALRPRQAAAPRRPQPRQRHRRPRSRAARIARRRDGARG